MKSTQKTFFFIKKKNAMKKLEVPIEAAMPCQMGTENRLQKLRETAGGSDESNKIQKTKIPCIVEAHEYMRKRFESTLPRRS